jgi:tRNA nucleotidyltransferase (CCA-adding enzyme)
VDKGRNVASAVKPEKIYTLVGAARAFLKTPRREFFFPPKTEVFSAKELERNLQTRASDCLFLTFDPVKAVPDVIWGQLYKTERALRKMLELEDFVVLRDAVWSDADRLCAFVFELEQRTLSGVKKHVGPPLEREKECEKFLQKYHGNGCVVSGPYIEDGRWIVEVQRKTRDAVGLLREKLTDGGRNVGVARLISQTLKDGFRVIVNGEVSDVYASNRAFAKFVTEFLRGKPFWLRTEKA